MSAPGGISCLQIERTTVPSVPSTARSIVKPIPSPGPACATAPRKSPNELIAKKTVVAADMMVGQTTCRPPAEVGVLPGSVGWPHLEFAFRNVPRPPQMARMVIPAHLAPGFRKIPIPGAPKMAQMMIAHTRMSENPSYQVPEVALPLKIREGVLGGIGQ